MIAMTTGEIAQAVGGQLDAAQPNDWAGTLVTGAAFIDTRAPVPGGLFIALTGEHADGHAYAGAAIAAGAAAVLANRPTGQPSIIVPDVQSALTRLATVQARRLNDAGVDIIGITGSAGKTSAKDLLFQILSPASPTVATAGSYNNEIGLPLTITRAVPDQTKVLILEMGAAHIGDITHLTAIAPPKIGIVLNVGTAHIGEFGGQDNIALAKSEIVRSLPAHGVAVLNNDDERVRAMTAVTNARVVSFGRTTADVMATDIHLDPRGAAGFMLHTPGGDAHVQLNLLGAHQVSNALAVSAAAWSQSVPTDDIAARLSTAQSLTGGRLQVTARPDGITIVNDAFNANPASVQAAIQVIAAMPATRRFLVLGEMAELGDLAEEAHAAVGAEAAQAGIDALFTIGDTHARLIGEAAGKADPDLYVYHAANRTILRHELRSRLQPGDVVLVKASHAAGLDQVADQLARL